MSFFERAKAAANDLAAKADAEMKKAGINTPGAGRSLRWAERRPGTARPRRADLPRGDRPRRPPPTTGRG